MGMVGPVEQPACKVPRQVSKYSGVHDVVARQRPPLLRGAGADIRRAPYFMFIAAKLTPRLDSLRLDSRGVGEYAFFYMTGNILSQKRRVSSKMHRCCFLCTGA